MEVHMGGEGAELVLSSSSALRPPSFHKDQKEVKTISKIDIVAHDVAHESELFTVLALDCDAPFRYPGSNFLSDIVHGLWCDLPACTVDKISTAQHGIEVIPWGPPNPPKGSHRYIFFALQQSGNAPLAEQFAKDAKLAAMKDSRTARFRFDADKFVEEYGLQLRAVAQFEAQPREARLGKQVC